MLFSQWWFRLARLLWLKSILRGSGDSWRSYDAPIRPKLNFLQRDNLLVGLCLRYCLIITLLHLELGRAIDGFCWVVSHLRCVVVALLIVVLNWWNCELTLLSTFLRWCTVVKATNSRPQIYLLNWLSLELLLTDFSLFRSAWRLKIRNSRLNFGG